MDLERDYLAKNKLKLKIARFITFLMIFGSVIYTFANTRVGNIEREYYDRGNARSYYDPYNYLDETTKKVIENTNNELNRQYGTQIFISFVNEKDLRGSYVEDYAAEQFNSNNLGSYDIVMVVVPDAFPEADFWIQAGTGMERNFERSNMYTDFFYNDFVGFLDNGQYDTLVHFTLDHGMHFYHQFAPSTTSAVGFSFRFIHIFNVFVFLVVFIIVVSVISGSSGGRRRVRYVYYNPVKRRFWHMPNYRNRNFHHNNFYRGTHHHNNFNNFNNFNTHNNNSGGGFGRSSNSPNSSNRSNSSGGFGRSSGSSSNRSSSNSSRSNSSGGFGRSSGSSRNSGSSGRSSSGRSGGGMGRRK